MIEIIPNGTPTIIEHPFAFFLALFLLTLAMGFWLGRRWHHWRIKRLEGRIDTIKMDLAMHSPKRAGLLVMTATELAHLILSSQHSGKLRARKSWRGYWRSGGHQYENPRH